MWVCTAPTALSKTVSSRMQWWVEGRDVEWCNEPVRWLPQNVRRRSALLPLVPLLGEGTLGGGI